MSVENILRLLALMDRVVIVDTVHDSLYEGVVEDVPCYLRDLAVASIAPENYYGNYEYLWIEVL